MSNVLCVFGHPSINIMGYNEDNISIQNGKCDTPHSMGKEIRSTGQLTRYVQICFKSMRAHGTKKIDINISDK